MVLHDAYHTYTVDEHSLMLIQEIERLREELRRIGIPVCLACGYRLRGLQPQSGRCPECGSSFDARTRELLGSPPQS